MSLGMGLLCYTVSLVDKTTLHDLGFSMPAEWAPHAATWTAWPFDDEKWVGYLEDVRREFAAFVNTLARFEPVHLLVADEESEQDARARLSGDITFHRLAHNDLWLRDSGAIFVTRPGPYSQQVVPVNWEFNGWGRKYDCELDNQVPQYMARYLGGKTIDAAVVMEGGSLEINGAGVCLTTRQCLLSPQRNPGLSQSQIEQSLLDYLGLEKILWLEEGLEGDHTDGHIDTITRFVDEQTIVTAICEDPEDANFKPLQANREALNRFSVRGQPFEIVDLPLPKRRMELMGERLPPTYANFYIANGAVLVPIYGDPNDERALQILKPLFPDRQLIGLMARNLITGGGAFHCVTQQQPLGRV
jgi:agmatine deiminase